MYQNVSPIILTALEIKRDGPKRAVPVNTQPPGQNYWLSDFAGGGGVPGPPPSPPRRGRFIICFSRSSNLVYWSAVSISFNLAFVASLMVFILSRLSSRESELSWKRSRICLLWSSTTGLAFSFCSSVRSSLASMACKALPRPRRARGGGVVLSPPAGGGGVALSCARAIGPHAIKPPKAIAAISPSLFAFMSSVIAVVLLFWPASPILADALPIQTQLHRNSYRISSDGGKRLNENPKTIASRSIEAIYNGLILWGFNMTPSGKSKMN